MITQSQGQQLFKRHQKMLIIHNFIDCKTNPVVKVVIGLQDVLVFNTIVSQYVAMKGTYFSFHGYRLTMVLNTEMS